MNMIPLMERNRVRYQKQWRSANELVARVRDQGLIVDDEQLAQLQLMRTSYHRLSGYWYPYKKKLATGEHEFMEGTTFDGIVALHELDSALRRILLAGIEAIEIALRARVIELIAPRNVFGHRDVSAFDPDFVNRCGESDLNYAAWRNSRHCLWLDEYEKEESRARTEDFSKHYRRKYANEHLPIWAAVENMSLGSLLNLIEGLHQDSRRLLAMEFCVVGENGFVDEALFESWLNHLRVVRNVCAHFGRLWNRNFSQEASVQSGVPALKHLELLPEGSRPRIYVTGAIVTHLLASQGLMAEFNQDFIRIMKKIFELPNVRALSSGFPIEWEAERIWQFDYSDDVAKPRNEMALLLQFPMLTTSEFGNRIVPGLSPKGRRARVDWLRKRGYVISVNRCGVNYFPEFQVEFLQNDESRTAFGNFLASLRLALAESGWGSHGNEFDLLEWWLAKGDWLVDVLRGDGVTSWLESCLKEDPIFQQDDH